MTDVEGPREIEAKFELDESDRARIAAADHIGEFAVRDRDTLFQEDLYYDTEDGALARSLASLRVRRNDRGAFMTFKGPRETGSSQSELHIASRLEDEVALDEADTFRASSNEPLQADPGLTPLVRARNIAGEAPLWPVARLRNERTIIMVASDTGEQLELALDRCVGTRLSDGRTIEFDEVELETKAASRNALTRASVSLQLLAPSLRPNHRTKLERTLR